MSGARQRARIDANSTLLEGSRAARSARYSGEHPGVEHAYGRATASAHLLEGVPHEWVARCGAIETAFDRVDRSAARYIGDHQVVREQPAAMNPAVALQCAVEVSAAA